jgi:hypothetical protein
MDHAPRNRAAHVILVLAASVAVAPSRAAGQPTADSLEQLRHRAVRVDTPPPVDGDLSHPVWARAAAIEQLVQQVPRTGEPSTERTVVRVLYDSTDIYVGIYCYEADPSQRTANILSYREDRIHTQDDTIRIAFDTFHDHRRAYVFATNPLGTKQDAYTDNESFNFDWNEVWDVATLTHEDGWSAVFRVPFRIMRFPSGEGEQVWGFEVMRVMQAKNESAFWGPHPPLHQLSAVQYYGHLDGMVPTREGGNLQFIPYVSADTRRQVGGDVDFDPEFGGDMKFSVGANASLDATYNTNFAQVEADDQQTNLTRFSLFLPEKREFFLENAQLFEFGILRDTQLFFSRRIGLRGGQPVPLIGGARLTGKLSSVDLGLITTQTESTPQAPSTNLSAARARWNVGPRSYVGGMLTSVRSDTETNTSVGVDSLIWLSRYLNWEGFVAMVDDPSLTKRPIAYTGALVYRQDLLQYTLRTLSVDDQFSPSLGFVRRDDIRRHEADLRRGWRLNRQWARKLDLSGGLRYVESRQGEIDTRQWTLGASNEIEAGDIISVSLERNFERLRPEDPFEINPRDELFIPAGDFNFDRWQARFQGHTGRSWIANVTVEGGEFYNGDRTGVTLSGTWRANPHLVMQGNYEGHKISLPDGEFATHLLRGRFGVPFTSKVRTDVFLQWNNLTGDGGRELSTQVRFRLTYGRDSDLFLVFTDQNQDLANGSTRRDQAIQMKLTYRLYR